MRNNADDRPIRWPPRPRQTIFAEAGLIAAMLFIICICASTWR
jgi:hypothetical protein